MGLNEVKLYNPVKTLFENYGYIVKAEIPSYNSCMDLVAYNHGCLIAVELKMSMTKGLIHQAYNNTLSCDLSYVAIPTTPRNIERCKKWGIGIICIKDEIACIILDARAIFKPFANSKKRTLEYCECRDSNIIGGLPNLKGEGPAQECYKRVSDYRERNPKATWREIFIEVPNHYANYLSMCGALRKVAV